MKARYTETALRELDEIFSYIFEQNRSAAAEVVERVETLIRMLEAFPFAGHLTDEPGVRVMPVVRYPFRIFYAIDIASETIVVLHVRHTARKNPGSDD